MVPADDGSSEDLFSGIDGATNDGNSIKRSADNSGCQHLFNHVQGAARDSECANLSRDCTADDIYVHGTANDSGSKDFLNGIDGTADDGSSEDLFDSIDGAADNGDSIKCSTVQQ